MALIATMLVPFCAARATTPVIGPNVNLSQLAGNQFEPAIAINPANTQQIFIAARNEIGGLATARSIDGGATWTRALIATSTIPQPGDVPRAYGNVSVSWDGLGNLFMTYLVQGSPRSATYVGLAVSHDGGATFASPTGVGTVLLLPAIYPPLAGDQPTVTTGPGTAGNPGSVWLTYFTLGGIAVSGASVSASGATGPFTSVSLPAQPPGVNYGDIAVGPNGEVAVTYGPNSGSTGGTVYVQVDPDGAGPSPFAPPVAAAPTNVGGFTFIPAQPNWGVDPEAGLAWDRTNGPHRGRLYLVYTDATAPGGPDTNIMLTYSDTAGASWSPPVRVNDDAGTSSQFLPRLSLDQTTGAIAITWYDARNSPTNTQAQYWGAFSTDGGATFTPNFQISTGMSDQARSIAALRKADYGDYTGNAFAGGMLVPAWADNANSTGDNPDGSTDFDVYTAIVQLPAGVPPAVTLSFPAPPASGWFTAGPVAGSLAASSAGSMISRVDCTNASVGAVTGLGTGAATAPLSVSALGVTPVSCTATDANGLTSTPATATIQLDSVAPGLAPALVPASLTPLLNAVVTALPNASDNLSGLASAGCGAVSTATLGPNSVACFATDNAGDTANASLAYVVSLSVANLAVAPVRPVHPAQAVRVSLQLVDASGSPIGDGLAATLGGKGACGVTATLIAGAAQCLGYDRAHHVFRGRLAIPTATTTGTYPLAVSASAGGAPVAAGSAFVQVVADR